jgi:hypothetical protein
LNNTGSFFASNGSGFFNGSTHIRLNKNYSLNNSIIFLSYEKLRQKNEILLYSATGNNFSNYSGFCLGVNDANKLYFRYWNPVEGPFTFTYSKILSDKNLIFLSRYDSTVSLGHYNNNTFSFEAENFNIFRNAFINNNQLFVGGKSNNVEWLNDTNNFSGYIDKLYIINSLESFYYKNNIASGFFSLNTGVEREISNICYNTGFLSGSGFQYYAETGRIMSGFVSGIPNQITGYREATIEYRYTGITGYQNVSLGFYTDKCGNSRELFRQEALSGLITITTNEIVPLLGTIFVTGFTPILLSGFVSGVRNIFVTGTVCFENIGNVTGLKFVFDENYLRSLSYKEILLFNKENSQDDIVEIFNEPYKKETLVYNKDLFYDNLNKNYFYTDRNYNQNEILLFANGQALIDSGYQLIPDGYETIKSPNLDYFITGTTVETNKFFINEDNLFYDYFSGNFSALKNTGNLVAIPNNFFNTDFWLFKNGQKLILNIDYIRTSQSQLNLINTDINQENYIIFKQIPNSFIYRSGNFGSFNLTGSFNHGCSQVYYNGIKQKINNNYIENATFDLISGNMHQFDFFKNLIYNNTNDFFV